MVYTRWPDDLSDDFIQDGRWAIAKFYNTFNVNIGYYQRHDFNMNTY